MSRKEFGAKVRNAAWERCGGKCEGEGCGLKLFVGKFHYDHILADGLGGEPTLENCAVLCIGCHHEKTVTHDRPIMEKADRVRKKHLGITKSGRGFQTNRDGKFKAKFGGWVVLR